VTVGGLDFMDRAGPFLVVFCLGESEVSSYRYLGIVTTQMMGVVREGLVENLPETHGFSREKKGAWRMIWELRG